MSRERALEKLRDNMTDDTNKYLDDLDGIKDWIVDAMIEYHENEVENLGLFDVSQRSELLIAFADYLNYNGKWETNKHNVEAFIKDNGSN